MTWPTLTPAIHAAHLAEAVATDDLTLASVASAELEEWARVGADRQWWADALHSAPIRKAEPPGGSTPPAARKSPLG